MFEEAIALDPEYAMAYIYLAISQALDVWFGSSKSPWESLTRAIELVQRAVSIDESLPESHGVLGLIYMMQRQHEKAIAEGELAVAGNPNSADDHARLGLTLSFAGRPQEAIASHKKAIRLNPTPPSWYLTALGLAYGMTGLYEQAIPAYKRALHRSPDNLVALQWLTATYSLSDREDEARAAAKEVLRIEPKFSLEYLVKTLPFKNQADADLVTDALRKAGLN
jgi:adenylate cyclase